MSGVIYAPRPVAVAANEHGVPRAESERAFNCGVGMVAVVAPVRTAVRVDPAVTLKAE